MPKKTSINPWITQLRKGLAELCVLEAVHALGDVYGYQLVSFLSEHEGLNLTESTVYPLLTRLAKDGRLSTTRKPSPTGPPRRYYQITAAGEDALEQMRAHMILVNAAINNIRD